MIDDSLPYFGLLMVKTDCSHYPHYELPEGYSFCTYRDGMKEDWVRIHTATGMANTREEASKAFDQKILRHGKLLEQYSLFIRDKQGIAVANGSLLPGTHFGEKRWQIYWVSVVPEHSGRHLCHALIARLIGLYCMYIDGDWLYLATQTWNYRAVSVYKDLGFKPYLGTKPVNWQSDDFVRDNTEGWRIVDEQIGKYVSGRFREVYERCLSRTARGELCILSSLCEIRPRAQGEADLVFLRKEKTDQFPMAWNSGRLVVISTDGSVFRVGHYDSEPVRLRQIVWYNIVSQETVIRPVSRQAFFSRMMAASGMLLRGCFPIMRHGKCYGFLPFGDTDRLFELRAERCRQLYCALKPIEVTGFYDV